MSENRENQEEKEIQSEEIKDAQAEETQKEQVVEPTTEELLAQEKDKFLRLFAEFENYKKRTSKERLELYKTANQELMTALLPILDDFDRGLAEIKKAKDKELLKGVELINDKLKNTLQQKGLAHFEVEPGHEFDAEIHEAITHVPAPSEKMKGKVMDVIEKGYKLGERIIRFPKVIIGK